MNTTPTTPLAIHADRAERALAVASRARMAVAMYSKAADYANDGNGGYRVDQLTDLLARRSAAAQSATLDAQLSVNRTREAVKAGEEELAETHSRSAVSWARVARRMAQEVAELAGKALEAHSQDLLGSSLD